MRTRSRMLFSVGVVMALVTACSSGDGTSSDGDSTSSTFDRNAMLRFGFSVSPTTWDPHKLAQDYNNFTIFPAYDRLLDTDAAGTVIAALAEQLEFSADGLALILQLRPGPKFHADYRVDAD